jgi:LacI family transcriptional regulator
VGKLAAEHFIGRGFHDIALFNLGNFWPERERKATFQSTIEKAGRVFHELAHYQWLQEAEQANPVGAEDRALRRLERELKRLPKPLAVFTLNDDAGVLVLLACERARVRVPEEVAVLGCHNDSMICNFAPVPLSSVDDDLALQAYEAARQLDGLMNGQPMPPSPIRIAPKGVVTRTSTNILALPHPEVAAALRFIWEHYTEPIQTCDVVGAVNLSERQLIREFSKHVGHGVAAEIARKRIERAKQLLAETKLKAWQVAQQCGFTSVEHLSKAFTRIVGQAPSHYRVQYRTESGSAA